MIKGISGGERKRVSIGYEMITDPMLLLCDEPTSGLDSSTALKIIKLLKKDAVEHNMTILCTIHQPSAEIFKQFDRLLLLQDGQQIYQGPILSNNSLYNYIVNTLGCQMPKYQNPADYVIKMAQVPALCKEDLTIEILVESY